MKKAYSLSAGLDTCLTVEIDTSMVTTEQAEETNEFWSYSDGVLRAYNSDVYQACARRIASAVVHLLLDGYQSLAAVEMVLDGEGWDYFKGAVSVSDICLPSFSAEDFECTFENRMEE